MSAAASCDVAVLGAGIAGLVAARELSRAGAHVVVLEARSRHGGRVRTRSGRPPLELGAEFLPPDGPAATELRRMGARLAPVPDRHGRVRHGQWAPLAFDGALDALERAAALVDHDGDRSLADALRASDADGEAVALATRYVEQYHAAPAATVSTAWVARMENTTEGGGGGDEVVAVDGLRALPRHLARGLLPGVLRLAARVRSVDLYGAGARITFDERGHHATLVARRALITFPPPLAARVLESARLPDPHRQALRLLRMGDVLKVGFRFRGDVPLPPGPDREPPTFFHTDGPFPTWWAAASGPALIAWAGGPAARALAGLGRKEPVRRALAQLAAMTGLSERALGDRVTGVAWRDWSRDELSGGAYAHAAVGGVRAADTLAEPVDGVLYLAGEAVSEAMGTVDGAWNSALRAVRQLLEARS